MFSLPANRLRVYRNFKAIEADDFYGLIRFYEQHESAIHALDFEAAFECTLAYTNALFETGQYGKHIVMCDFLLETIIRENVGAWGGEDIYTKILYDKAIALFHQMEYLQATHIGKELVRMRPDTPRYQRFLQQCLVRQKPSWLWTCRAVAILLVLGAAALVALHLFLILPFMPDLENMVLRAHYVVLGLGVLVLTIGEGRHVWQCRQKVRDFWHQACRRKQNRAQQEYLPEK